MKTSKTKKQARPTGGLRRRGIADRKAISFPQMKGRMVENIELFTTADFHAITIDFQDKIQLNLILEPCVQIVSNFADRSSGEQRILKRWPTVRTLTNSD